MSATRRAGTTADAVVEPDGLHLDADGQIEIGAHHREAVPRHVQEQAVEQGVGGRRAVTARLAVARGLDERCLAHSGTSHRDSFDPLLGNWQILNSDGNRACGLWMRHRVALERHGHMLACGRPPAPESVDRIGVGPGDGGRRGPQPTARPSTVVPDRFPKASPCPPCGHGNLRCRFDPEDQVVDLVEDLTTLLHVGADLLHGVHHRRVVPIPEDPGRWPGSSSR